MPYWSQGLASWGGAVRDLGIDAASNVFRDSLPLTTAIVADAGRFNRLVDEHGLRVLPRASAVELLPGSAPSSNCTNGVLQIEWAAPAGNGSINALPRTLYVKLPAAELSTRAFCNAFRIWERECVFYRNVAPRVPLRTPTPYIVAHHRSRFVLVLEDLTRAPGVTLFNNHVMIDGPGLETVRACLTAFAELHAAFWGLTVAERERLLPEAIHPFVTPGARANGLLVNRAAMRACRRRAPDVFHDRAFRFQKRALANWNALVDAWFTEPLTLLHGDSHIGNFFRAPSGMGMLDWQAVHWGKPLRDVQYFLIDSLPEDVLADNEHALIEHYVTALAERGAAMTFDEAWQQYRACAFQTLMTAVVSKGLGVMTDMDDVIDAVLRRSIAAAERLDLEAWLEGVLR